MSNKADYTALAGRTQGYALQVKRLFDEAVKELLDIAKAAKTGQVFSFDQTKTMADRAQKALRKLHAAVTTAIERGIQLEWGRADKAADELVASVFGRQALKDKRYSTMLLRNDKALNAFMKRADNGMNLSKRVWQSCESLQKEMELAISVSVGEGVSADTISRRVRQYLNEPNKLFRRVRKGTDADGNPIYGLSKAAAAYHPGRGVYRSSYKNAMRLARTETNMAYRTEDCSRMSKLDFVLGVRINLSRNHPEKDICDELAGDYPKTFKFTGWHPQCRCFMTSILPSADELKAYNKALLNGENYSFRGQIRDFPAAFKDWVRDNAEKIENGSSVPYFVSDNQAAIDRILGKGEKALPPVDTSDIGAKINEAMKPTEKVAFASFEPFSPIIMQKVAEARDRKAKEAILESVMEDTRASVLGETEGQKTILFPDHKGTNKSTWNDTKQMAFDLNKQGVSVAFLPEFKDSTSADAMLMASGKALGGKRFWIVDFKYCVTANANTLQEDLIDGFGQASAIVLKLENMDSGTLTEALEYIKRNEERRGYHFGDIILQNKYGKAQLLRRSDIRTNRYRRKIKGFL